MLYIESKGYIYKITNTTNSKIYIGQTSKTVDFRFKQHIADSKRKNKNEVPLYKAFNKYGVDKFTVEILCECELSELNKKEMEYINLFNSYKNGYNATLGGSGFKIIDIPDEFIISTYLEQKSINKTMNVLNIGNHERISETLKKHNIEQIERSIRLNMYKNDLLILSFNSLVEASNWIIKNNLTKEKDIRSVASNIRKSIIRRHNCYGYKFKSDYYTDEYFKDKNTDYLYERPESSKYNYERYIKSKKDCPECGKKIDKKSNLCDECAFIKRYGKRINHPDRENLKNLIRDYSFAEIGRQFKVNDNSVRKWCKKYDLPYKSTEIKKYSDEEWKLI